MISSARPSLKYSSSGSRLMLANGSTAIDGADCAAICSAAVQAPLTSVIDWKRRAAALPDIA